MLRWGLTTRDMRWAWTFRSFVNLCNNFKITHDKFEILNYYACNKSPKSPPKIINISRTTAFFLHKFII